MHSTVRINIDRIKGNITETAIKCGRNPSDIRLMAVSKTVDDDRLVEAINAGVDMIGENYVQEAKRKIEKIGRPTEWHMIGHLQTNKAKYAVRLFDMIHSVDRLNLAIELDRLSLAIGKITKILIEVNMAGEATKSGAFRDDVLTLVKEVALLKNLSIQGLMTIPPWFDNPQEARPYFASLRELKEKIVHEKISNVAMKELSMGMSEDYPVAIEEGATIVRIGRSIFGERS
jgi:pyridoxal phosphate enzyme (YggS family)